MCLYDNTYILINVLYIHTSFTVNPLHNAALCLSNSLVQTREKEREKKKERKNKRKTYVHVTRFLFTSLCCFSLLYQALSCVFKAHYHKIFFFNSIIISISRMLY